MNQFYFYIFLKHEHCIKRSHRLKWASSWECNAVKASVSTAAQTHRHMGDRRPDVLVWWSCVSSCWHDSRWACDLHSDWELSHTHTHTHVCFCENWGHPIGIMVFILYKLYVLLPYTNPTPKLTPHRRLSKLIISTFPPKKLILYDL